MPDSPRKSPMQRMKSLRLNSRKKIHSIKQNHEGDQLKSTNSVKWSKTPDVLEKVLSEATEFKEEKTRETTVTMVEPQVRSSPRVRKTPKTKSNRNFFKLPTRVKTPETKVDRSYTQQIDLREIEICQQIGRGASSAGVFLCLVDGWACAMKQLKKEHVGAIDIRCFEREMDILYQLPPHPSIVRYLFHTSLGTDLCLFMQLYSGTLREHLDERRKTNLLMNPEVIARIALESARGIQFLHQHGVIHRDIKAGNIFITKNDEEITRIAIGDFDTSLRISASLRNLKDPSLDMISHDFNTPPESMNTQEKRSYFAQNRPRSTVGTAGFMAPEVLRSRGSTPYGFKADIYSFGMLLYEMITLKLPFEQLDTCDIIDAVLEGQHVASMKIDKATHDKYLSLVDLHLLCTRSIPDERPSIGKIVKILTPKVDGGDFVKVERRPTLVEQLNRYNLSGSGTMDTDVNVDNAMEQDIKRNSTTLSNSEVVTFRGPQTQPPPSPPTTRFAVLGTNGIERDSIPVIFEDSEMQEESVEDSKQESKSRIGKSVSNFREKRVKKKKDRSKDKEKKKVRRSSKKEKKDTKKTRTRKDSVLSSDEDDPKLPQKRPKRNTISKTTLQRMVDGKLEDYDPDSPPGSVRGVTFS